MTLDHSPSIQCKGFRSLSGKLKLLHGTFVQRLGISNPYTLYGLGKVQVSYFVVISIPLLLLFANVYAMKTASSVLSSPAKIILENTTLESIWQAVIPSLLLSLSYHRKQLLTLNWIWGCRVPAAEPVCCAVSYQVYSRYPNRIIHALEIHERESRAWGICPTAWRIVFLAAEPDILTH